MKLVRLTINKNGKVKAYAYTLPLEEWASNLITNANLSIPRY